MLFEPNSRVERVDEGLRFYEQDIIFSEYVFHGNVTVDMHIDYLRPGFGIIIAENHKGEPRNSERAHLFKLGNYRFQAIEKDLLTQVQNKENACLLAPGNDKVDQHLVFSLKGTQAKLVIKYIDPETKKEKSEELGSYKIRRKPKEYFIGFYSNKGNIIRSLQFLQGAPKFWATSIKNTEGGRISFFDDGFQFEKCVHDAEIEQDAVELEPGTYYVAYDKEPIDGIYDIDCFVFPSKMKEGPYKTEDRFYVKKKEKKSKFMLSHYPIGDIQLFINERDYSNTKKKTYYTYDKKTNTVTWTYTDTKADGFEISNADVLFIYECDSFKDSEIEDQKKNILQEDGSFTLKEKTNINLKFQGTQGKVKNICIKDDPDSSFVETNDEPLTVEASYIRIKLDNLSKILWSGIIYNAPEFTDYTKLCPYGIAETKERHLSKEDLYIKFGESYDYEFDVASKTVTSFLGEVDLAHAVMPFVAEDNNKLTLFHNMRAIMTRLILIDKDGKEIDVLHQRTYKKFVPAEIKSPIFMFTEDDEPFDLSSAYREVVDPEYRIDYFSPEAPLKLKEYPLDQAPEVYGIPFGTTTNPGKTEMVDYAKEYDSISESNYEMHGQTFEIKSHIRAQYRGIAVRYRGTEKFHYYFTNYEREYFEDEPRIILEKPVIEMPGNVIIYGFKKKPNLDYLYRVPSEQMVNAVDLCSEEYDLIPAELYDVSYVTNEIVMKQKLRDTYPYLVVDYLKDNSYAINYRDNLSQYEVDIAMSCEVGYIGYDMTEDGKVNQYVQVPIKPDKSKFILLRRKTGEWEDA